MYAYASVYVCVYMYMYMYIYLGILWWSKGVCVYVYVSTCVYMYMYKYIYIGTLWWSIGVYVYVNVYTCVYMYMYVYIYIGIVWWSIGVCVYVYISRDLICIWQKQLRTRQRTGLFCVSIELFWGSIGLFSGYTGLFWGSVVLFCGYTGLSLRSIGLFGRYTGLFWGSIGLFCGYGRTVLRQLRASQRASSPALPCDMTHSGVWHDSCMCGMTHSSPALWEWERECVCERVCVWEREFMTHSSTALPCGKRRGGGLGSSTIREVGGWGRVPCSRI